MKNLKRLLQQLAMINRILIFLFLPKWSNLINSIPGMTAACTRLQEMADSINLKIDEYRQAIKGITKQKRDARIKLAASSFAIMSSVRSWAIKNSNFELAAAMTVTLAELKTMRYDKLIQRVGGAITTITPLVPQLSDFNVNPANFLLWKADHTAMKNLLSGPQSAIQQRKTLGSIISNDVTEALDFVDNQLNPLMSNFLSTPEFYNGFQNLKRIGTGNVFHTRLVARVVNEVGAPYYAITVTVDQFTDPETKKTYEADSAITDSNGNCEVSEFFPGFRTVTVSGPGIQTTTFPATEFRSGKAEIREYVVAPSFNNLPSPSPEQKQKANS